MKKKKIALVGFHLYGGGGARVMANLSNYFQDQNIEVHNIILHDELGFEFSGELFNLGKLKNKRNTIFNKVKRFIALRKYIKNHDFDFVIDFRFRKRTIQEYLISRFIYNRKKTIYTIHSSKLDVYIPKSKFWAKVIYGKSYQVITLTKEMEQLVKNFYPSLNNVLTIPNSIDVNAIQKQSKEKIDLDYEYIIAVGSFDNNFKQFDKLIEAYADTLLPKKQVHLVILGKGKLLDNLKYKAKENGVENFVHFLGSQPNPFKYIAKSKFLVLSSAFEGFPMILIEGLACEIPLVSFNCKTGPSEIIKHEQNGLLVEDQNIKALAESMNTMLDNQELYKKCKENTLQSVQRFSIDKIGQEWMRLINVI